MKELIPKGVIGIFTSKNGDVIATSPVFEMVKPGGWTLVDSQRVLAQRRLAYEVAKSFCSSVYADAMEEYDREKTMKALQSKGYTALYITVGHEEGDACKD